MEKEKPYQQTEEEMKKTEQLFNTHLPSISGRWMWQDPLVIDKNHPLAEMWQTVIDLNQNIETLVQNNAVTKEIREAGQKSLREILGRTHVSEIYDVPSTSNRYRHTKRVAISTHSAYCLMIMYSEVADMLGLQEEKNEFLKNALKVDIHKELQPDYEEIMRDEFGESLAMEVMARISHGIVKVMAKADGRTIKDDIFSDTFIDKSYLREIHSLGNKYSEETMRRYDLSEGVLKEAVNELIKEALEKSNHRLADWASSDYAKYVDYEKISDILDEQVRILLNEPDNAYNLLNFAAKIFANTEAIKGLAKKYIDEQMSYGMNYDFDSSANFAKAFGLEEYFREKALLLIKNAISEEPNSRGVLQSELHRDWGVAQSKGWTFELLKARRLMEKLDIKIKEIK